MKVFLKVILVVVLVVVTNVTTFLLVAPGRKAEVATETPEAVVNVVVEEVVPTVMPDAVLLPASVEPALAVKVPAEVAGTIEIDVAEGATVTKGQEIARIDARTLKAVLDTAEASHKLALSEYRRTEMLHKSSAISDEMLEAKRAVLTLAEAGLETARINYEKGVVSAPITGVFNLKYLESGEFVNPGDPIAEIVHVDEVKVTVDVPEKDVTYIDVGSQMWITVTGKKEDLVPGTVTFRSVVADPETRTYRTEVTMPNSDRKMLPGMIVKAVLLRRVIPDALSVPLFSVVPRESRTVVFVEEDGRAREREVKLGVNDGEKIQVTEGLEPGERLIVVGQRQVGEGQKVRVITGEGSPQ